MIDTVIHGDALATLKGFPDNYVDSIVCDPPAGINFMNKSFDADRGGRDQWIAWLRDIMIEAKRCLRPGGHALVWALPRTSHWTATALEDAGFEVRDAIFHHFGSGFPKSTAIDKQIDKMLGAEREEVGVRSTYRPNSGALKPKDGFQDRSSGLDTAPATPEAAQWAGYGTALKPSTEIWWLVRKPLAESSIAANVLAWGTGGLAIDACRVGNEQRVNQPAGNKPGGNSLHLSVTGMPQGVASTVTQGRWPSHLLLSHSVFCQPASCEPDLCPIAELDRQSGVRKGHRNSVSDNRSQVNGSVALHDTRSLGMRTPENSYDDIGGASRYFECFSPETSNVPFLYQSKASRAERNAGCEGLPSNGRGIAMRGHDPDPYLVRVHEPNAQVIAAYLKHWREKANLSKTEMDEKLGTVTLYSWFEGRPAGTQLPTPDMWLKLKDILGFDDTHDTEMTEVQLQEKRGFENSLPTSNSHPTVKSLALMRWLIRLITPPGGTVLDCFLGSGSTAVAAIQEGMHFIGIEAEQEYVALAQARIAHAMTHEPETVQVATKKVKGNSPMGHKGKTTINDYGDYEHRSEVTHGMQEEVEDWDCAPDCPIRIIGEQSGERSKKASASGKGTIKNTAYVGGIADKESYRQGPQYTDTGSIARYFQHFPPDSLFADDEVAI